MKSRDFNNFSKDVRHFAKDLSADDVLRRFGLSRRGDPSVYALPALGVFSVGMVIGLAVGMLTAPKRGKEMRGDVKRRVDEIRHKAQSKIQEQQGEMGRHDLPAPPLS